MSFLAPYMLWGAVAAGVPIALHFFFRSRYRRVPWAAMKFLLTSIEQTSRRLRFQELLLLLARVALLILLALALARPSSTAGGGSQGEAVTAKLQALHPQATLYLVRCGTRTPRNVAVVGIVPQSGVPHTGERAGFSVLVRNSGSEAMQNLTVSLSVDSLPPETQPLPIIPAGETRAVPLTAKLDRAGLRVLSATVKPDELEAHNRFDQVIQVRDQVRVLVVDGTPNDREPEKAASFYLLHGLLPVRETDKARYHIQPRLVSARQASP